MDVLKKVQKHLRTGKIEYVLVDFFDTLVHRDLGKGERCALAADRICSAYGITDVYAQAVLRIRVESEAFAERAFGRAYTYRQVTNEMLRRMKHADLIAQDTDGEDFYHSLLEIEQAVEMAHLYPDARMQMVLRDLLDSGRFATVRLTEIFRQAQQSLIVTNAHAINRGEMPRMDVKDNDFFFLPRATDKEIADTVAQLYKTRLPRTYGEMAVNGTQVITPSRKGETGTENLNVILQQALNPPASEKREHRFRELVFREGDRVMQIRNNYDLEWEKPDGTLGNGIFNGDIGVIERINPAAEIMEITFDDRHVAYEFNLLDELEMAYAVTVHKSQGSEYPIVILPLGNSAPMLLSRNLFYTAVTRAQNMVILVGREEIAARMVGNNRQSMRYTGLVHWLGEND